MSPVLANVFFNILIGKDTLKGNFVAILSGVVYAIYTSFSKSASIMKKYPISVYLILMSGYIVVISYVLAFVFNEKIDIFSKNERFGLLAFITDSHSFLYGFIGLGLMAGFVYNYFILLSQEYIGVAFINVCYNFIPFTAQMVAFAIGVQEKLPGSFTYIGG